MESIPIERPGRQRSHLAVRYSSPAESRPAPGRPAPPAAAANLCLLYLHGFGSEQSGEKADFFRRRAVAAGFAFCSFDFEGHGLSGGDMRGLTMSRNLENLSIVAAWLAARGHPRVCLIGSSMGGGIGLWFSALHPEQVIAGLHIAPALDLEGALLAWAGPERARAWQESGVIQYSNDLVSCELSWDLIEDLRSYPTADLLLRYRTPALLLQGRLDVAVPWRGVADFATRCPFREIELHLFADGDHRLTDRKDRLWELMLEFLHGHRLLGGRA
ncbi:MAG TPA: alpha/beta hydrolase [Thermoanaerobaculia bacterium]|nr:alpha/beta hydrolase [Thermoanaerobaculia bacterium]